MQPHVACLLAPAKFSKDYSNCKQMPKMAPTLAAERAAMRLNAHAQSSCVLLAVSFAARRPGNLGSRLILSIMQAFWASGSASEVLCVVLNMLAGWN